MDHAAKVLLLNELATGLEASESQPLTPLVRRAIRLAAALGENEYQMLFQLHLDGISDQTNERTATLHPRDPERARRAMRGLIADRTITDGNVSAHSLPDLETLVAETRDLIKHDRSGRMLRQRSELQGVLNRVRSRLGMFVTEANAALEAQAAHQGMNPQPTPEAHPVVASSKIFIGHGRSAAWRDLRDFLQNQLGLEWDEFNREATAGMTVTERLEEMLKGANFAFLVMTAEDEHADATLHARENVVHEVGLCQGALGRRRAIVMLEDECAEFSNIVGLGQIRFRKGNLLSATEDIRGVLKRERLL